MSGKPLIPSKDALRALRSLVYSPPAAFIGTAGAFCGVAVVHYHERQKLRKAEAIVETKRRLHSISKGKGSTRLAYMIDAAERGDDFTIHRHRAPKSSSVRHNSTLEARQETHDAEAWKPFNNATRHHENTLIPETEEREPQHPRHRTITRSTEKSHQSTGRMAATRDIHDGSKNLPWKKDKSRASSWSELQRDSGRRVSARLWELDQETQHIPQLEQSTSTEGAVDEQSPTDLNPLSQNIETKDSSTKHVAEEKMKNPFSISLDIDTTKSFATNAFSSLRPWEFSNEEKLSDKKLQESEQFPVVESVAPNLYLSSSAAVPTPTVEHQFDSRYDFDNERVRQGMSLVGTDRYFYVFTHLMNIRQKEGKQKALEVLEQTMENYTLTEERSDFALVQALFLDCVRLFSTSELRPLIWRYVEKFLQTDVPRLEVVSFLYPRCGAGARSSQQYYYFLAQQYLEALREKGYGLDQQIIELRKVLAGTRLCEIELHEHLMIPALRSLCAMGRMTLAQALFDEMVSTYNIEATSYSLQILVKGYAKVGNWSKIKSILDGYHSRGLSEKKAYAVSGFVVAIIDDYSITHPPERVVNFVVHCINEYGLQPLSEMTRKIVSLCFRHRRYDLAVNWIHMVQTEFPHVDIGTSSSTFAFDISSVWKDLDASCEDVLHCCRAIAVNALRDPFSKVFRVAISEAVTRYLTPRLLKLRESLGPDVPDAPTGEIGKFHTALKKLKENRATKIEGSRARLLLTDLLSQGDALRWLNALCRGHLQSQGFGSRAVLLTDADWDQPKSSGPLLSSLLDLQDILAKQYVQREKAGLPINHDNLRDTAAQLVMQGRESHAFDLIQSIYDSRWAQPPNGLEFDLDLFIEWSKLALKIRSGSKLRSVLWALIDASPELKLSPQIVLLARIAAPKTHLQKTKHAKTHEVDEVEYLRLRLRRRLWGSTWQTERLSFDTWHGFEKTSDPFEAL